MIEPTGDVLKVSTVLQPRTTSRHVISRALALNLDQNREVLGVLSIPRSERLQKLETIRLGVNLDLDGDAVLRRGLEGVLSWVIAAGMKLETGGRGEFEGLARGSGEVCVRGLKESDQAKARAVTISREATKA